MVTIELTQKTHFDLISMMSIGLAEIAKSYENFEKDLKDSKSYMWEQLTDFEIADIQKTYDDLFEMYPQIISELKGENKK